MRVQLHDSGKETLAALRSGFKQYDTVTLRSFTFCTNEWLKMQSSNRLEKCLKRRHELIAALGCLNTLGEELSQYT